MPDRYDKMLGRTNLSRLPTDLISTTELALLLKCAPRTFRHFSRQATLG